MRVVGSVVASCLLSLVATGAAHAIPGVQIIASGTWDSSAPTTDISAPGATWSISFLEPNPLYANPGTVVGQGWSTDTAQSVVYELNGSAINLDFSNALFYDSAQGGGVDVNFDTHGASDTLSIYSNTAIAYADENSGAVIAQPFSDNIGVSYDDATTLTGSGALSITSATFTPSNSNTPGPPNFGGAIPEPSDWVLITIGVGMVGAMLRRHGSARLALVHRAMSSRAASAGR